MSRFNDEAARPWWNEFRTTRSEAAKKHLIETYLPLVRFVAERMLATLPPSVELDDLVSAGNFGLMDAIDRFDTERGVQFKTYCVNRVRGAILDDLRANDWVPRLVRLRATAMDRVGQRLCAELGRDPTADEMADAMNLSSDEFRHVEGDSRPVAMLSLTDESSTNEDGTPNRILDAVADSRSEDPVGEVHRRDVREMLLRSLTEKERTVISLYYYEGCSMKEIARTLGLTESRVCQIHSKVMRRLEEQFLRLRTVLFA